MTPDVIPSDIGRRFYCDRCRRKIRIRAAVTIVFGIVAIGGVAALIRLLVWIA